jgi:solute carrier family 35, member F5
MTVSLIADPIDAVISPAVAATADPTAHDDYQCDDARDTKNPTPLSLQSLSSYTLGIFFILLQCVIWILNAVLTQSLNRDYHVDSSFLMTYIGMSLMAPLLPLKVFADKMGVSNEIRHSSTFDSIYVDYQAAQSVKDLASIASSRTERLMQDHSNSWNHRRHFITALLISPAMFLADWSFNEALFQTSVSSATVLVSIQAVFVYVLAVAWRLESYNRIKLAGVLTGIAGIVLTTMHDTDDAEGNNDNDSPLSSIRGDVLALFAAFCYAFYTVEVRLFCPENEELYSMQLLLGYVGLICFLALSPFFSWELLRNLDKLSAPVLGMICFKGFFDFCATDYLMFRAIVLTNATVATVGLGLTIPMAFVVDFLLKPEDAALTVFSIMGAVACSVGFLLTNLADYGSSSNAVNREETSEEPQQVKGIQLSDIC